MAIDAVLIKSSLRLYEKYLAPKNLPYSAAKAATTCKKLISVSG